jgi:hypothetical protein
MKLYEIDNEILSCVDVETGEIFDIDRFEELELEREAKIENICLWIKNLKAEAEALKAEKEVFANRQKSVENKMESLKRYISSYLDGTAFESTKVKVSYRKSESVEVAEGAIVPDEYLRFKEPEVDKTALKKAIKGGLKLDGVSIVEKNNIQIK